MSEQQQMIQSLQEENVRLRRELQRYHSIIEHLSIGLHIYQLEDLDDDRTLRMVGANPVVEALTGVGPDAIVGKTLDESFPGLREQGVPQAYAEVVRTGTPFEAEQVYGDEHVIESAFAFRTVPLPNQELVVMFENITQRKQTEHALKQANAELDQRVAARTAELYTSNIRLERIFEASPLATIEFGLDGRIIRWNQAAEHIFGWSAQDVIGRELLPLVVPPQAMAHVQQVRDALLQGQLAHSQNENVTKDGRTILCQWYNSVLRDQDGNVTSVLCQVEDISERKRREDELHTFQTLVENAPNLISVAGRDGRYQYFNPAFRTRIGIDPDMSPEQLSVQDMAPGDEDGSAIEQEIIANVMAHGSWTGRTIFKARDGSTFPGDLAIYMIYDQHGQPDKFVAIATDITEQLAAEAEHAELQQQVIDAQRNALRELSTPLIPVSDNVVIMPLIGTIDSRRAQQVMETLLEGVAQHQAELAILDITGVSVVDTQVAQALVSAAQAVRLLGAQVMLTGIGPQIAQTLVQLGIDLSSINTRGSLQAGIVAALHDQRLAAATGG
jgi:rsbT co-antagonist protein RsbR